MGFERRYSKMANENKIYIERRQDGKYTVSRGNAERASAVTDTQRQAIDRAKELNPGHRPDVERVRNTDKGGRDKWRKA
jgi:uncharacterized protein YdaT